MRDDPRKNIEKILDGKTPSYIGYGPNYWQRFNYQKNHDLLDDGIKYCQSQFDILSFVNNKDICYTEKSIIKSEVLSENLTYLFNGSILVQNKFLIDDYQTQLDLFEKYVTARKWKFNPGKYEYAIEKCKSALMVLGEFFSPLKILPLTLGPVNSVYFLLSKPDVK